MTKVRALMIAAALIGLSSDGAFATVMETFNLGPANSIDAQGDPDNFIANFNSTGGYTLGRVDICGTLTEVATATFASEARLRFTNPAATPTNIQPSTVNGYTGSINIGHSSLLLGGADPAGNWSIEFFESTQDGTAGLTEQIWDPLEIRFTDEPNPFVPGNALPVFPGNFTGTPFSLTHSVPVNGTTIHVLDTACAAGSAPAPGVTTGAGQAVDGTQYTGSSFSHVGPEIGFAVNHPGGDLILDLTGLSADLDLFLLDSTGVPSTGTLLRSEGTSSEHIELLGAAAGTYYAVVDSFAASGSNFTLTYTPEPGSLALLGLGLLGLIRRRR